MSSKRSVLNYHSPHSFVMNIRVPSLNIHQNSQFTSVR